jgi:diphosphomevalonate decarboxylase
MESFKPTMSAIDLPDIPDWQTIRWLCPSNIALIKYWGKHGNQLPDNPSLSFTLSKSITRLNLQYKSKEETSPALDFLFENKPHSAFKERIDKSLKGVKDYFPFLDQYQIRLNTANTFPHSSGIASSASAMGALALSLCSMEHQLMGTLGDRKKFYKKASFIARLASGSASRSVFGGFVTWGKIPAVKGGSDLHAQPLDIPVHDRFRKLRDAVLIVSSGKKRISSSAGHHMMVDHAYHNARKEQAIKNFNRLLDSLQEGNFSSFASTVEYEALSLHALMMASQPGYILMETGTLRLIDKIREIREQKGIELCFTLDAGPNIHLLYPADIKEKVVEIIRSQMASFCENRRWIDDHIGDGPVQLEH